MRFPPPVRFTAPLLALVFGLVATWFDYRLNLDLDVARHLGEMHESADANGRRLARLTEPLLAAEQEEILRADVEAMADLPGLEIAGVVDELGRVVADSAGTPRGRPAAASPLAAAAGLMTPRGLAVVQYHEDAVALLSAYPFRMGTHGTGWVLLEFDRTRGIAAAQADARTQLGWMASAMALLSFALWTALHFGFGARLARLADSVRAFGEGKANAPAALSGGDEVGALSGAFSAHSRGPQPGQEMAWAWKRRDVGSSYSSRHSAHGGKASKVVRWRSYGVSRITV